MNGISRKLRLLFGLVFGSVLLVPNVLLAEEAAHGGAPQLDGAALGLYWVAPFTGVLLSIALLPLLMPHFWHNNFGKVAAFWALSFVVPFAFVFGFDLTLYELLHVALLEYIPFIILLLTLFTVAGGVRLKGKLSGTPFVNTVMLAVGTLIASLMGTTGAAMLLIRPMIAANEWRTHKAHVFIFFIFLVANVGGALTPLGDPPLFLGFLKGVDFFWPTAHLFLPMIFVAGTLLVVFYIMDKWKFRHEIHHPPKTADPEPLGIEGGVNILLMGGVIGAVLLSGIWDPEISFTVFYVEVELQNLARDVLLLGITLVSLKVTSDETHKANAFSWFPIVEVAKLFAGIFLTIIPAIAILKAGEAGQLSMVVSAVTDSAGQPINTMYFWLTGILSSFLDNAPTYLVFFNTAGGEAETLMGPMSDTLMAISAGAVFMGANTYVGNAPNFMVRAIAEDRGIHMPSFFGYMAISSMFLLPTFFLLTLIFF